MAVIQWNPWADFETFTRGLHRVFDVAIPRPLHNGHQPAWQPRMDVHETDAAYVLQADLPGVTIDNITVQLEGTTLTIAGERQGAPAGASTSSAYVERPLGPFRRAFTLPAAVQGQAVHATYTNGVLTVTVPKADTARPRQIPVRAA